MIRPRPAPAGWLVCTIVLFCTYKLSDEKLTGNRCLLDNQFELVKTKEVVVHQNSNFITTIKDLSQFKRKKLLQHQNKQSKNLVCVDKVDPCITNKPLDIKTTNFTNFQDEKVLIDVYMIISGRNFFCIIGNLHFSLRNCE